ncbi:rod shape-determining protein MreC, partial [Undibacterium sp. 10I3]
HGVALSQPVIDDLGVVGQVTRVFLLTSEVTLLTDKNQAIPVQITRNGLRSVVYGRGQSGYLDMRMTSNADVHNGDVLVTSGIDGVYPAGLAVAKVVQVENKATTQFENILCTPSAGIDKNKQLLILLVSTNNLPRPDTEDIRVKKEKLNRKVTRDAARESPPESLTTLPQKSVNNANPAESATQSTQVAPVIKDVNSNSNKDATKPANKELSKEKSK